MGIPKNRPYFFQGIFGLAPIYRGLHTQWCKKPPFVICEIWQVWFFEGKLTFFRVWGYKAIVHDFKNLHFSDKKIIAPNPPLLFAGFAIPTVQNPLYTLSPFGRYGSLTLIKSRFDFLLVIVYKNKYKLGPQTRIWSKLI